MPWHLVRWRLARRTLAVSARRQGTSGLKVPRSLFTGPGLSALTTPAQSSGGRRRGADRRQDREDLRPVLAASGGAAGRQHLGRVVALADPALDADRRATAVSEDLARRERAAVVALASGKVLGNGGGAPARSGWPV